MSLNVQIFQDYNYKQKGMNEIRLLLIERNKAYMVRSCMINIVYDNMNVLYLMLQKSWKVASTL